MHYHGLFVGIDHYLSPDIAWLSCAVRDATALHALFADTLGDGGELLSNEQATRAALQARFAALATCDPDDIVVLAFSGHGSPTHELVTADADVHALAQTAIPLAELTEWFARIPARQLICFLDCCFSGGMGAKVLQLEATPRGMTSITAALDHLAGEGRLILTASAPTEEAWEHPRLGHGLLTYFLLEALQGAPEVRQSGKVSIYQLLDHVTARVTDAAAQFGAPQHPTLRGRIDRAVTWPVFVPGPRYMAAFPEQARVPVSAAIHSLESYGFPPGLLTTWAGAISTLNALQLAAINDFGLLDGDHLVVSAPTSSGKTMIGELAALKGVLEGKRALFLLPLKALVNDKHRQFTRLYESFGLTTIRATGEIADDIPALMRGRYDICLMTYEKFAALTLAAPHLLQQVGTIVVDEVQMLADPTRGANLEFLLTLLRVRRADGMEPQLIALSAVIGDTNGLERWLGARLLLHNERPVPLDEGILRADGSFRFLDGDTGAEHTEPCVRPVLATGKHRDWLIPLVRKLVEEGKQVIVFRETKGETVFTARYLAEALGLPPAATALQALPVEDPSAASAALRDALAGGVAFHNADLDRDERLVIEEQFRAPETALRVIAATTTLAMGVNTPAEAVVIEGLEHPGTPPSPYTVAE
ncbi:MAG TPA: DEAD/DEAH box helicase, partial [Ktedonobacterales bacterium]|nr:DEAD/DEAH box helicase [Ktedonobacterales bacterium]